MTTAREVMHFGVECLGIEDTLGTAAKRMSELDVGAMPVCENSRLRGIITDRDIVVKCVAKGGDPSKVKAGDLIGEAPLWWVEPDTDVDEVLHHMVEHKIRRLPVLDHEEIVGIISQADLAAKLPEEKARELVEAISTTSH